MKISLVLTVLNEEKHILKFLSSLQKQSKSPDEAIIVDGGSLDGTVEKLESFIKENKLKHKIRILKIDGNISKGRNTAIRIAKNEVILCSDAGCELDKDWIKNISSPFKDKSIAVVSGFYKPTGKSVFQKCLATYTSVMPDKLNSEEYLPSSRSIAFKKSAWEKAGRYPEWLDRGEDLYFARKLKEKGLNFIFAGKAVVYWEQRKNIHQAFRQFFLYAVGDGKAHYFRKSTPFLFGRYILGFILSFLLISTQSKVLFFLIAFLFIGYVSWSINKNYKYVKHFKALFYLPLLQFTSDFAVISGMAIGLLQSLAINKKRI